MNFLKLTYNVFFNKSIDVTQSTWCILNKTDNYKITKANYTQLG